MPAICDLTPWRSSIGGADGGWRGAYGWSNKPPPLARKMASHLFKYRWASLASKEGAFPKKVENKNILKTSLEEGEGKQNG